MIAIKWEKEGIYLKKWTTLDMLLIIYEWGGGNISAQSIIGIVIVTLYK